MATDLLSRSPSDSVTTVAEIDFSFNRILFPVDFSERCREFAHSVRAMARQFDARVTALHIVEPAPGETVSSELLKRAHERLEAFAELELKGLKTGVGVTTCDPAPCICKYAAEKDCDVIMMPTRGQGVFRRLLLGSVTAKVLHDCIRPVWTGPHKPGDPAGVHIPPQQIVCAVNLAPESAAVLQFASSLAKAFGARLLVAHALMVLPGTPDAGLPDMQLEARRWAERDLQELLARTASTATPAVVIGETRYAIETVSREQEADLLVIGRTHAEGLLGQLGSKAYGIISHAPCPVLSV